VELTVESDGAPLQDATVKLAGRTLAYDVGREAYVLEEEDTTLLVAGGSFELVVGAGSKSLRHSFQVPGGFDITSPAANGQVSASQPVQLKWTASQGATSYYVGFSSGTAGESTLAAPGALSHTFDAPGAQGEAVVRVEARAEPEDIDTYVTVALVRERAFTFAP